MVVCLAIVDFFSDFQYFTNKLNTLKIYSHVMHLNPKIYKEKTADNIIIQKNI
jgi:hypothetical protein